MSNINEFKIKVIAEKAKVIQNLLKMIAEVSENTSYLDSSDKIEILSLLNSIVVDINKFYDKIEQKENPKK